MRFVAVHISVKVTSVKEDCVERGGLGAERELQGRRKIEKIVNVLREG